MAVTRVSAARSNGTAAVKYAMNDQAKNKKSGTKRALVATGLNVDPLFAAEQMQETREAHGKGTGFVQAYRIIQSFGPDELDPNNIDDAYKANEIGMALAEELYGDREVIVVTQNDGLGGKLHNHIIVNSVAFVSGKSIRDRETHHDTVSKASDAILERYGMEVTKRGVHQDEKAAPKRSTVAERRLNEKGEYSWRGDASERISTALADGSVTSLEGFVEKMKDSGVDVVKRGEWAVTYKFEDEDGKQRKIRGKTLGADYDLKTLQETFEANQKATEAAAQKAQIDAQALQAAADAALKAKQEAEKEEKEKADAERKAAEAALEQEKFDKITAELRGSLNPKFSFRAPEAALHEAYEKVKEEREGKVRVGVDGSKRAYTNKDHASTALSKVIAAERAERSGPVAETETDAETDGPELQ